MRLDVRWIALALMLPLAAAQADTSSDYAYAFPLDTKASAEAYRIVLSPEVYAAVNPSAQLRDMVVVNGLGRAVPFGALPPVPPAEHKRSLDARLLPVPPDAVSHNTMLVERGTDGGIVISQPANQAAPSLPRWWLFDAGRAMTLDSLALVSESLQQDFQIHVALEGSDDLRQWRTVASDAGLVRVRGESDEVEQLTIQVDGSEPYRYYRMRLVDGDVDWSTSHAPMVHLEGSYTDAAAERDSQLQWLVAGNTGAMGTDYDYVLPAALPVEAIKVQLPAAHAAARVHLQLTPEQGALAWFDVSTLDLVRAGGKGGDAVAHLTPRATRHVRLHSETPLTAAPVVSVGWVPPQYVFMAEGGAPYRLLAGSYAAKRGDYPMEQVLDRLHGQHGADWLPPVAVLGARVDAAGEQALQAPKVPFDWTRSLLWGVLVVGALAVAGMALSLLRQSRREESGS